VASAAGGAVQERAGDRRGGEPPGGQGEDGVEEEPGVEVRVFAEVGRLAGGERGVLGDLGPYIGRLPLLVRTLVLTAVVVPAAVYVLVPALLRLDAVLARAARRADVSPSGGPRPPQPGRTRG
jgi:hypothetical protein